jgi:23S rRNA pseudouridine2605 synthase
VGNTRLCRVVVGAGASSDIGPWLERLQLNTAAFVLAPAHLDAAINTVTSSLQSQGGHPTVEELVPVPERVYPVGRLDLDSEGLLLLTNDGDLAHRMTHPSFEHEKEYLVWLDRDPSEESLDRWRQGLQLPGLGRSAPAEVERMEPGEHQLRVVMHEGMKRQIRVTAETLGFAVVRLLRVRMGSLSLGGLAAGSWRPLTQSEVVRLRREADLKVAQEVG